MNTPESLFELEPIRKNKLDLVERLADDLAHEIKNPLHSMVINLEVLRRRLSRLTDDGSEDMLRFAGVIGTELDRVSERVELLLRMVRPGSPMAEPATLGEVLDELREILILECKRHRVELDMQLPEIIPRPQVPRDAARQLILSVVLATLDATAEGGTITLSTDSTHETVSLRIASSGGGEASSSIRYLDAARALAAHLAASLEIPRTSAGARVGTTSAAFTYIISFPSGR